MIITQRIQRKEHEKGALAARFAGPAVLLALVVLFNWKLLLTNQYTWLESPDLAYQVLPWFQFEAGEWQHGRIPLWEPNSWFGQPLIGQAQPGAAYPPNWLLFLFPLKHGWMRESALHWYYVLIHYFAALTAYALARDLKRSRSASILAGCLYALGGYVASVRWPQMINGAVWSPLVLLYLFRVVRKERPLASALLSGFFLGFGWLAGHHQMNFFLTIAVGGMWLWLIFGGGETDREPGYRPDWQMVRFAACSLFIAALASAFQTLPMVEYGSQAVRWVGSAHDPVGPAETIPYSIHEQYAIRPIALLGIVLPGVQAGYSPFIGVVGFTLGILGVALGWKDRRTRVLALLSLAGIAVSLGPNSVLHGILYSLIPLVDKARVPAAAILLFSLGIAPLAAFGLDLLSEPNSNFITRKAGTALAVIGCVLILLSSIFFGARIPNQFEDGRPMVAALCALLAAAVFTARRSGSIASPNFAAACLIGLILLELGNDANYYLPTHEVPAQNPYLHSLSEHADLAAYVRGRGEAARVDYDDKDIPYNIGDWDGIETSGGYLASVTGNVWKMDVVSPRAKNFFGIRYYFGRTAPNPNFNEVFKGRSGLKVFENPAAYPRVWSVHSLAVVADRSAAAARMADTSFNPLESGLLISAVPAKAPLPALGACRSAGDDVQMPRHNAGHVSITASLACTGMVMLTDTWFPGWQATVDGKTAPIYETYGGVRGVVVDAGKHIVDMRYRPLSVILGAMLTSLAAAIVLIVRFRISPR